MFFIASDGRLGAGSHLKNSLGRKPSRFVSSLWRLTWSSQTSQRGPKLYKPPSPEVSQVFLRSSTQPVGVWRQFISRASTCFSLATWKLEVLAAPAFIRSLSQNCSEAADAQPHRCSWAHVNICSLARATGPVFFHGSCQGWYNQMSAPAYETQ